MTKWIRCGHYSVVVAISLVIATPTFATYENNIKLAVDWLNVEKNPDGTWGTDLDKQFLNTVLTADALHAAGRRNNAYYQALTWLSNHSADNADYLARRAKVLAPHGDNITATLKKLESNQDSQQPGRSGWGANIQYLESPLDTAIVLSMLSTLSTIVDTQAAVNYLKSTQLSGDGGWPIALEYTSDPMSTALVIKALAPLVSSYPDLATPIGNGLAYLQSAVNSNSTHHLQALAAHAALVAGNFTLAGIWLDALKADQSDGNWSNSVYATALVTHAMAIADGAADGLNLVNIPDPKLRAAINAALGRNAMDNLDRQAMSRLTTLIANNLGIENLTGLEWAVNLDNIDLRNNNIQSTAPIDNLSPTRLLLAGNPVATDTDGDGMPDNWETDFGLDIASDDRLEDSDSDGFFNFLEYIEQTDPTDPASKPLAQYAILDPLTQDLTVVGLYDDTVIQTSNTLLSLQQGDVGTLPAAGLFQGALIWGDKPFAIGGVRDATDMPVPLTRFAATRLVIPHARNTHRYYLMSPYGDATVTVTTDEPPFDMLLPQGQVVTVEAGATNDIAGILESDLPILAAHAGNSGGADNGDAYPVPPPATSLWGIRSTSVTIGVLEDNTQVTVFADDGTTQSFVMHAGELGYASVGTKLAQAEGSALRIVADKPVAALQTDDSDGLESTAFFDQTGFGFNFAIPADTQYVAVVCMTPGAQVTLYDGLNQPVVKTCTGAQTGPGKAYFGSPTNGIHIQAGAYLQSDQPVYVIYEPSATNDEHNLLGSP